MNFEVMFRGIMAGFLASITLGPVAVMCIQRTLSKNRASGFVSGLGATTADSIFAMAAYFFVAIISPFIEANLLVFKVAGGLCVVAVGVHFLLKNPVVQIRRNRAGKSSLWQDYASTFALTLTNPAFILWVLAIFSTFNVSADSIEPGVSKIGLGAQVILGFSCGAIAWWTLLTSIVEMFRSSFRPRHMLWINRCAGVLIIAIGVAVIVSVFV